MKNQFFEQNLFCTNKVKEILKSKDINFEKITLENEFFLPDDKIKIFENIFESQKLIDCNEKLFDEENYFIKTNSLIHHYETKNSDAKYIEDNNIKKAKKSKQRKKFF